MSKQDDKDGGPAFPLSVEPTFQWAEPGMSVRDYIATATLAGLLANPQRVGGSIPEAAETSYLYADAMLKARKKATSA